MAQVVLENVSKVFSGRKGETVQALTDLSLTVADHEFVVLVGPSGSGKTTTLRLTAGLESLTSGTIRIDGQVANHVDPKDRDVAMVFQNYALYPHLTAYENMVFGLKLRRFPAGEADRRVREVAETLGLTPVLGRLPRLLSGGQRQRVALGRAMVRRPKAFLFDEPLSNLDAPLRLAMRGELKRLQARLGATTLYVTHDQVEAMTLGDRLAVLKDGILQQVAPPLDLYHRPANLFVATFIGSPPMNLFRGTIESEPRGAVFRASGPAGEALRFRLGLGDTGRLAARHQRPTVLGLRPEQIVPALPGGDAGPEFAARIQWVEPTGAETYVHLEAGGIEFAAKWPATIPPASGAVTRVRFDPRQAYWFDPQTGRAL